MDPSGGRSTAVRVALVALLFGLVACSNGADAVMSTPGSSSTTSPAAATVAGDESGARADDGRDGTTTTTAPPAPPPTTTTPPPITTTTAPPPTTTTPPPTTTTTAPPPPPPTTTTTAPPPPPPTTTAAPQHGTRNTGCEQYMYDQINAARADVGQPALALDGGIRYIPLDWSDEMARTQVLAHNPEYGNQIFAARAQARTAGENVGRGYAQESLFQAFMDSPGHRNNIESPNFSHITIGCLTDSNGQIWVAQNFWG